MKTALILASLTLLTAPVASVLIIYSGIRDIPIPLNLDGVYIVFDDGSTSLSDFTLHDRI